MKSSEVAAQFDSFDDWRLIGRGEGVHWEALDEDISIESLLAGRRSGESQESLKQWLKAPGAGM